MVAVTALKAVLSSSPSMTCSTSNIYKISTAVKREICEEFGMHLDRLPPIMNEAVHGFPQSLQANAGIVP
jgi:hypothetical protein